jgi:hypothetical protein
MPKLPVTSPTANFMEVSKRAAMTELPAAALFSFSAESIPDGDIDISVGSKSQIILTQLHLPFQIHHFLLPDLFLSILKRNMV